MNASRRKDAEVLFYLRTLPSAYCNSGGTGTRSRP